jgi:hypothetical protein
MGVCTKELQYLPRLFVFCQLLLTMTDRYSIPVAKSASTDRLAVCEYLDAQADRAIDPGHSLEFIELSF